MDMWIEGTIGKYQYCAKVFDTTSSMGINGGRVSKLDIYTINRLTGKRRFVASFDRGWAVKPLFMGKVNHVLSIVTA